MLNIISIRQHVVLWEIYIIVLFMSNSHTKKLEFREGLDESNRGFKQAETPFHKPRVLGWYQRSTLRTMRFGWGGRKDNIR